MITTNQLAQLAASINTEITAAAKVKMAWDIWHAADHMICLEKGYEKEAAPEPTVLKFSKYLAMVYPQSKPPRIKLYRDFLKDELVYYRKLNDLPPYSELELLSEFEKIIEQEKTHGVRVSEQRVRQLREHREQAQKRIFSDRGVKGATQRKQNKKQTNADNEKNGTKTKKIMRTKTKITKSPQVKKKKPQAKNLAP